MNDTDTTATYSGPDYGLGDDNALAHDIASFDYLADTTGPVDTSRAALSNTAPAMTLDALPPRMREPILAELGGLTGDRRAEREAQLVHDTLLQNSLDLRIAAGPGANANPFQQAVFSIANQLRVVDQRHAALTAELAEITGYDTRIDPATGKADTSPIYKLQGDARNAAKRQLMDLAHERGRLDGPEGERERQQGLKDAVAARKGILQQLADDAEAKRRGAELIREERINKRAEAHAKGLRSAFE